MADLAPLTEDEVKRFMERWYLELLDTHAPMEDVAFGTLRILLKMPAR